MQNKCGMLAFIWVRRQEIGKFMTPTPPQGEILVGVKSVEFMHFFKNHFLGIDM